MAIIGSHVLLYSSEPDALRTVLRDAFGWSHVDAGEGWLIFALPPSEMGVHPAEAPPHAAGTHQFSLMCDDIQATIRELQLKGVDADGEPTDAGYGITVMLRLPGGVRVQLYQPRHRVAIAAPGTAS